MKMYYDMTPEMEAVAMCQAERLAGPLVQIAYENARQFSQSEVCTMSFAVLALSMSKLLFTEDRIMNGLPNGDATREFLTDIAALVNQHRRRIHDTASGVLN